MPLIQELASQQTPAAPLEGIGGAVTKGLDVGLGLAAARQKQQAFETELTTRQQELEMKQNDFLMDALGKAANAKDPKVKRLMLEAASKRSEQLGKGAFNPDMMALASTETGGQAFSAIMERMPLARKDTKVYGEIVNDLVSGGFAKDTAEGSEMATKVLQRLDTLHQQEIANSFKDREVQTTVANKNIEQADKISKETMALRDDAMKGKKGEIYERYSQAKNVAANMDTFIKDPSSYGDTAIILQGSKVLQLDASVVREAEMNLIKSAGGVGNFVQNVITKAKNGEQLTATQRSAFKTVVDQMAENSRAAFVRANKPVIAQAKARGQPMDQIFNREEVPEAFADEPQKTAPPGAPPAAPPGTEPPGAPPASPPPLSAGQINILKAIKKKNQPYEKLSEASKKMISKAAYDAL